ncbi:MAG: PilN domain-containing protein [Alteromonadaceae bacterium]|nr:PilN domain-containing protein [Alteromonadaceae bacterium]
MAYINLLPWREEARKAKEKEYFTILALVALMAFGLVFMVSQFYQARIDGQVSRNQFLKDEIKVLDIKIAEIQTLNHKKTALQQRISVIEQLQRSRNVGTQVLNEISKIVPGGIYLTKLDKQGSSILLIGKSESNNHLANMIREIEASDLFVNAVLESIISNDAESKLLSEFKMRVRIEGLKDETAIQGAK